MVRLRVHSSLTSRSSASRLALLATALCVVAGVVLTFLAWLAPGFDVAYGSSDMHVAVEMTAATVGVVVGFVAFARYRRLGRLGDLAVAVAVGFVMPVTSAFLLALPTVLNYGQIRVFSVWSSLVANLLAALLLAVGGLKSQLVVRRLRRRSVVVSYLGAAVVLALVSGLVLHFESVLPRGIDPALSPVGAGRAAFTGSVLLLAGEGASTLLLAVASLGYLRGLDRDAAPLSVWTVPALATASVAAFNYTLFPTLYSYWVYTGEIIQLAAWLIFTCGVLGEVRAYAQGVIEAALLEERRRLARDLHDGIAQELAFIATGLQALPEGVAPDVRWMRSAAERALHESRRAIAALTEPLDQSLKPAIRAAVSDVAERAGVELGVDVEAGIVLRAEGREALLRVAREATVNAVRHASPTSVGIVVSRQNGMLVLSISDDGDGFDPAAPPQQGFGLTSMRERVESAGGTFRVRSTPGAGTVVEASWRGAP